VWYASCKCVCVCVRDRERERKREREGERERMHIRGGIKPKPQDISDLEGEWVKPRGRREGGERKERERKGRNKEREIKRGAKSLEGSWSASRTLGSNNHDIPAEATKPGRGGGVLPTMCV